MHGEPRAWDAAPRAPSTRSSGSISRRNSAADRRCCSDARHRRGSDMTLLLGAIADDFTGATDLANTLVRQGMRTVQLIGVPARPAPADVDALVVALKSRTVPAAEAVAQSLAALRWLVA